MHSACVLYPTPRDGLHYACLKRQDKSEKGLGGGEVGGEKRGGVRPMSGLGVLPWQPSRAGHERQTALCWLVGNRDPGKGASREDHKKPENFQVRSR